MTRIDESGASTFASASLSTGTQARCLIARTLKDKPCRQLNLPPGSDCRKYSANIVGEVSPGILKDCLSVAPERKRALGIGGHAKIGVIEKIIRFDAQRDLPALRQQEALLKRQIKLRERRAPQDVPPSVTELAGRG